MTQPPPDIELFETPQWLTDTQHELLDHVDAQWRDVIGQAVKEGASPKRITQWFAGTQAMLIQIGPSALATGFAFRLENICLIGYREGHFSWASDYWDEHEGLRKIAEDGIQLVCSAVDGYAAMPSPREALCDLHGLRTKLVNTTRYVDRVVSELQVRGVVHGKNAPLLPAHNWIDDSIALVEAGQREKSLDVLFDHLDELLIASKFGECDAAVAAIPVERLNNAQLLTVLTATAAAKEQLPSRAVFYEQTKALLQSKGADVDRLLVGLE